jgi:dTDP-4-dehydrorhamnose reductase
MANFLILGGNSKLAKCFAKLYPSESILFSKKDCNIKSLNEVENILKKHNEKYVLNFAAVTDIEYCENNIYECLDVNTYSVKNLETLCKIYRKKLIHISSDYAINPINIYGTSKYVSENLLDHNATLIIRTSFYNQEFSILKSLLEGKMVNVYDNMFFNPISINRLAQELYLNKDNFGIINIFSRKKISKYDFAILAASVFGLAKSLIKRSKFKNISGYANRPLNSFVTPDISVDLIEDMQKFKLYLQQKEYF